MSCSGEGPPKMTAAVATPRVLPTPTPLNRELFAFRGTQCSRNANSSRNLGLLGVVVGEVVLVEDDVAGAEGGPDPRHGAPARVRTWCTTADPPRAPATSAARFVRPTTTRSVAASPTIRAKALFSARCSRPSSTIPGVTTTVRPSGFASRSKTANDKPAPAGFDENVLSTTVTPLVGNSDFASVRRDRQ